MPRTMVHSLITREVKEGKEAEFEAAIRRFFSDSMSDPSTTGAQLVRSLGEHNPRSCGILRSFPDEASRQAFYTSEAFHQWEEEVAGLVDGPAVRKDLHGLEAFFHSDGAAKPPPVWKMALLTWVGVNLVTTPLLFLLMPVLVGTYGLRFPFDNFVFNVFVVSLLSWFVMPAIVKLAGRWLTGKTTERAQRPSPARQGSGRILRRIADALSASPGVRLLENAIAGFGLFLGLTTAILHGWPKLLGAYHYFRDGSPWRDIDLVVALGLPLPALMATIAGLIQFFCSLAVGFGWLTRLNALLVLSTLGVALYWNAAEGKDNQVALLYFAGFALLAATNSGRLSLDSLLARNRAPAV